MSEQALPMPGVYRHYKGRDYLLHAIARHSESEELLVVYEPLYDRGSFWVRPLAMWGEQVEDASGETVERFRFLHPAP